MNQLEQLKRDRLAAVKTCRDFVERQQNGEKLTREDLEKAQAADAAVSRLGELIDAQIETENAIADAYKRTNGGGNRPEARYGVPLAKDASFSDLPDAGHMSAEKANEYLRNLITGDRRALSEGTATEGGYAVPTPVASSILDRVRASSAAMAAGASVVPMESLTLTVPRLDTDPSVSWRAEAATIPESAGVFGSVQFTARAAGTLVKISRELVEDAPNVEATIVNALGQAFGLETDRVALYGTGTSPEPGKGLFTDTSVNAVALGSGNGGSPTYDTLIDQKARLTAKNYNSLSMVANPRLAQSLAKLKDGQNAYLTGPAYLNDVRQSYSSIVPVNHTVGTSTDCSEIFMGDFGYLAIGMRTEFVLTVLRERFADTGQIGLIAWMRLDTKVLRPDAFETVKGVRA